MVGKCRESAVYISAAGGVNQTINLVVHFMRGVQTLIYHKRFDPVIIALGVC